MAAVAVVGVSVIAWRQATTVADLRATLEKTEREAVALREQADLLTEENADLAQALDGSLDLNETIQDRADDTEIELDRLRAALERVRAEADAARQTRLQVREVRGTADFPIERAMAEAGDTVAGFAAREGTTEAVVRALNPWLDGADSLSAWQTLWVPKTDP
ncbi:LysM peptidoglycan-binding domain-containing protein [Roseospira visakhapatnamensis]|uniref:Chromosome segregation ATPase n=1 Tax=Roseospira visakhapatnamensis TaxID=390880 RepID=A0A7W6RDW1_9PROT|nr:hypothetical protein [Roseospira visakhapatnamensis]MBB4266647.1 chromosome segregation ATPase [Roseospira visakhapatnamensis]